ncbi:hypothetical protein BDU57DRAFT_507169 [Ampelomyces quisqualis]|uniref:Uncharacterized protein n=1 Tax=Ampelomyces quisqualis TaxID=50730 RepID=A0A6A5Q6T0_AMPQU|nr:hypothetical protein BDU57DRAFT_507169 [Ampelomyces quisqualis]
MARKKSPHFRIAIDFGTTFTTIAFIKCGGSKKVLTVEEWPGARNFGTNGTQVPTEMWYSTEKTYPILYGYEITRRLELPEADPLRCGYESIGLITKPKLLLDKSAHLEPIRKALMGGIRQLKKKGVVKKSEDVVEHLLTCFLKHVKSVLERDHDLNAQSRVEITFAVPVCWSATANAVMRTCLQAAMKTARFGFDDTTTPSLFMVNEAEAAAMHALTSDNLVLNRGECFILLDCGGGTTDSGMYKISYEHPLRLGEEVTHPKGVVCGSGDLNVRMHKFAASNLRRERYLENAVEGITIDNIIDSEVMPHFESEVKRAFDITKDQKFTFRIRGLRESTVNPRLKRNCFDLNSIFIESLNTIEDLLLEQIDCAQRTNTAVDKVVLVGGFGDSPALKEHLKASLARINNKNNTDIKLVLAAANTSASGVAVGAIMRAQDKTNGPRRVPYRSIGILHHVSEHAAQNYPAEVLGQLWEFNELDQGDYIMNTVHWIIKAGKGEIETVHTFQFNSMHFFDPENPEWIVEEALFASDTCVEDYYALTHPKNKAGKVVEFGTVEFDVTHLKDRIQMYVALDSEHGSDRYEVVLLIKMKVIDRHFEFTAYWPADDENAAAIQGVQSASDLSSAFRPGTA